MEPKGWHSRGYLLHFDGDSTIQFVTWRTNGSYPKHVLDAISQSLKPNEATGLTDDEYMWDSLIDQSPIGCFLTEPQIANTVINSLQTGSELGQYNLFAWTIMPNHVHVLLQPLPGTTLPEIVKGIKSVTSRKIQKLRQTTDPTWGHDYFDRFIRNEEHFHRTANYIHKNAYYAHLVNDPADWPFSSDASQHRV